MPDTKERGGYVGPVDALADELLAALRDHPASLLDAAHFAQDDGRLQAAYNRLHSELHDDPNEGLSREFNESILNSMRCPE